MMDGVGRHDFQPLRMVCSRWPQVCFSTPKLWSSVTLFAILPAENQGVISRTYVDLLKGWFQKAGEDSPLDLAVEGCDFLPDQEIQAIALFVHSFQTRWRYLSLELNRWALRRLFITAPQDRWINLQHIVVDDGWLDSMTSLASINLQRCFPVAKTLELTTRLLISKPIHFLPKESVETLLWNAEGFAFDQYAPLLSSYPQLTSLDLRCGSFGWGLNFGTSPITLERLTSLSFTTEMNFRRLRLLQQFRLPSLSRFELTLEQYGVVKDEGLGGQDEAEEEFGPGRDGKKIAEHDSDTAFVPGTHQTYASFESLKFFSLKGSLRPEVATSILSVLPNRITNLHLQTWPYATSFFDAPPLFQTSSLTTTSDSAPWLPKLEAMRIFHVPSPSISQALALRSINSLVSFSGGRAERITSYSRLARLGVTRGTKFFSHVDFEELETIGLKVTLWAKAPEHIAFDQSAALDQM
ncbi:hypothetical protein BKA70DRAFT_1521315 [Coprinopsis sp. MPI-PUGE-AT-0042]|nr:hypothetical protein BKA70DRAFT_1521315 [Coprinopsis sp. MPI-PUGE-AT-0042]